MLPSSTSRALKEWAVIVRALEAGQQLVILRKGGISETGNEFRIEFPEFLFYPTYEHQKTDSLVPAFETALKRTLEDAPDPGTVRISSFAKVTASFDILSETQLAALRPYHIWSEAYALDRLHWRPTKPLAALALRVYQLPDTIDLPFHSSYRGCTSWITLGQEINLMQAQPVLNDATYERKVTELSTALNQVGALAEQRS
ncbi:MAG: DUF1802 family protein [Chloroflexota bacterium]